ncbi:Gfo/Idh/MocA family protein [Oenococcus alcoholitolerans]|uniref:Gfo/Idh/MocA family protein n=1 Tax=Oenococcus alcoholitolerans TaxID=931074 RepID=UPI003F724553
MINFGIIGPGNIANRFADSLQNFSQANLYAVAARNIDKARVFQAKHPSNKVFGSYQELLQDPNIDIVYIALPHQLHFQWSMAALDAGKAVISEKPAALNREQLKKIIDKAKRKNLFYTEAMKSHFQKAYQELKKMVTAGEIGKVKTVQTSFCRSMPEEQATYHYQPLVGGCLLDMGIYNAAFIESFVKKPLKIESLEYKVIENKVEVYVNAALKNDSQKVILESAFDRNKANLATIIGDKGRIEVPNLHRPDSFTLIKDNKSKNFVFPYEKDDFHAEIKETIDCLQKNRLESRSMPVQDSLNSIEIIDELKQAIAEKEK